MSRPVEITAKGDREVVIRRTFDAPREHVFDAWTKPELLRQWLGVRAGWTMPVCEVDLRVGGSYRYVWRNAKGTEMGMGGRFVEIVRPERIVATEKFDHAWYPGGAQVTNVLKEAGDTTISVLTVRYDSKEARDLVLASPMESGMREGYAMLDQLLARVR